MSKINPKVLNILKSKKKHINFILRLTPKSKKAMTLNDKITIQEEIITIMKKRLFKKLNCKIAINIEIYAGENNMPNIENFLKNLLDILHKTEYLRDKANSKYLPFEDDKDIKYIYARYNLITTEPSVVIDIQPFSSFVSDIRFARNNSEVDSVFNQYEIDDYYKLIEEKARYKNVLNEESFESLRKLQLTGIQERFGEMASISPLLIDCMYPSKVNKYCRKINQIYYDWSNVLLKQSIFIRIDSIPSSSTKDVDYKKKYKESIVLKLQEYRSKHPLISEILIPITVSVFYQQPKILRDDYKDLDNIMREYIVPSVNIVYQPPVSYWGKGDVSKSLIGSSIGYEIIEVPRKVGMDDFGFISIGLKFNAYGASIMKSTEATIDKYLSEKKYLSSYGGGFENFN